MTLENFFPLKKPHPYIMIFILRKRVALCPTFLLEVGNNVLTGDWAGVGTKYPDGFVDPCLMMAGKESEYMRKRFKYAEAEELLGKYEDVEDVPEDVLKQLNIDSKDPDAMEWFE